MRKNLALLIITLGTLIGCSPKKEVLKLMSTEDTLSYSIGVSIGHGLQSQNITGLNPKIIAESMDKVLRKDSLEFTKEVAETFIRDYFTKKQLSVATDNLKKAESFMAENKKQPDVNELPSGLQYIVLTEGNGPVPNDSSMVKTHYKGTFINGEVFESSYESGEPAEFPINGVIPGWTEALKLMKTGSKWRLFIPPHLAYGEQGAGDVIGPNVVLIFELELLEVNQSSEN